MLRSTTDVIPRCKVADLPSPAAVTGVLFLVTDAQTPLSVDAPVVGGGDTEVLVISYNGFPAFWRPLHAISGPNSLLRFYLGRWQLYDPDTGKFLTFVQTLPEGFSVAEKNGDYISAQGPGSDRSSVHVSAKLFTDPVWANRQGLFTTRGQSRDGAATTGAPVDAETGDALGTSYLTYDAPLPASYFCSLNGTAPSPAGPSSPASDLIWPDEAYKGDMVPAKAGINVVRQTGKDIFRETPGISAGLVIANALPEGGRLDILEVFAGSSTIGDVTGHYNSVVSATYSAGTITYNLLTSTWVQVGDHFGSALNELTGISPAGYAAGGIVTAVETVDDVPKIIKVSAADPGAPSATVTTGEFLDWGIQAKNCFNFVDWWLANAIEPGKTPFYVGDQLVGHESATTTTTLAGSMTSIHDFSRRYVTHIKNKINPAQSDPPIAHAQNDVPNNDFDAAPQRIGETMVACALLQEYIWRNNLDSGYLTHPMFMMESGGGTQVSSPHNDMTQYPQVGSINGHSIVEFWNGDYEAAPRLGETWTMILDQPGRIVGTTTLPVEIDTVEVPDPNGNGGLQVFNLDIGAAGILNRFTIEQPNFRTGDAVEVDPETVTLEIDGTDWTITADDPIDPRRVFVAAGWKLPRTLIRDVVNANITSATWNPSTHVAEIEFDADNGYGNIPTCRIYQTNGEDSQAGWNNLTPGWTWEEGSTTSKLVTTIPTDPGTWDGESGRTVAIAQYSVGRSFGNVHCFCKVEDGTTPKRWNIQTGEWLRERMLTPQPRPVFVRSSQKFLVDQRTEIIAGYAGWASMLNRIYDFADDRTWAATGTAADALGNTADDLTNRANISLTGTHNSGSRSTYAEVTTVEGYLTVGASSTLFRNAHKRGAHIRLAVSFLYKTRSQNQYVFSTCAGEGLTTGPGILMRINSAGSGVFLVRADDGLATTFQRVFSGITFTDGVDYLLEMDIKDSDDGTTPGWGWIRLNGVVIWEDKVLFGDAAQGWTAPSTNTSQSRFCLGVNGVKDSDGTPIANPIRRLNLGWRYYFGTVGSDTTLAGTVDTSDWTPAMNSWKWRQDGNTF